MEISNGDLYAVAGREVRRYEFLAGEGSVAESVVAPGAVVDLIGWGGSFVAVVHRDVPTAEGLQGSLHEVTRADAGRVDRGQNKLALRHLIDFAWAGDMRAEASGSLLAVFPTGVDGIVVFKRALTESVHLPLATSHREPLAGAVRRNFHAGPLP